MKRAIVLLILAALTLTGSASADVVRTNVLLTAATATGAGEAFKPDTPSLTLHAYGSTASGSGAATIVIEVSNVATPATNADWITAGTISLTLGTTRVSDGFSMNAPWLNLRARVTAISGTGAAVNVIVGRGKL